MELTENFKHRLKQLAGIVELDSKSPQHIALKKGKGEKFKPLPPQPQPSTGSFEGGNLCNDPNWINLPDGDPIGGPNYSWFKHDYCDRCGHNMSNIDPPPASGTIDVPAYIGFGAAPGMPDDQITWNIGPPWGAEIDFGSDSSVSLGSFCDCCGNTEIEGCTDPVATNYNSEATTDDGSCEYESVEGCTDPAADNYDSNATIENNTCEYTNFDACAEMEANPEQYYWVSFGQYTYSNSIINSQNVEDSTYGIGNTTFPNIICSNACHNDAWNGGEGFQMGGCLNWANIYISPEVACWEVYNNYSFSQTAEINSYNNCSDVDSEYSYINGDYCCVNITGPI